MSRRLEKKSVIRYEDVPGTMINFDKSEGLRLDAWRSSVLLPTPFRRSDRLIRNLEVWFGPGLQLERNWLKVKAKVEAQVGTWLRRRSNLKVCAVCLFSLIVNRLSVLLLPKCPAVNLMAIGAWKCQILIAIDSLKDWLSLPNR